MRKALIILAILLAMTGLAFAIAPVVAPIPPGVLGPPVVQNPAGSVPGTTIHSDVTDDIGIIVDNVNGLAYKSWWVHNPYVQTGAVVAGSMYNQLGESLENGVGFSSWLSAKWDKIKEKLQDGNLENYPALDAVLGGYLEVGPAIPLTQGQAVVSQWGGYYVKGADYAIAGCSTTVGALDCPTTPNDVNKPPVNNGVTFRVACRSSFDRYLTGGLACYKMTDQSYTYVTSYAGDVVEDWPQYPPAVWNPAVDSALNDPAVQTDPAVKEELGQVIADNPDVLNPILDKLTATSLAASVEANQLDLAGQNIQSLMDQVAADPTNVAAQIALNDALAKQAEGVQQALEEQALEESVESSLPEIDVVELRSIDWTPLSGLIGVSCASDECPFPFDFIHALGKTFNDFQNDEPIMVDPSGIYGFGNFKINFNFDFSRFTETMAKIRLMLSWLMTIYTIHKCVRIVTRDNAAGDDD